MHRPQQGVHKAAPSSTSRLLEQWISIVNSIAYHSFCEYLREILQNAVDELHPLYKTLRNS